MRFRSGLIAGLVAVTVVTLATGAQARDFEMGGDTDYPYSIMAPERGTPVHRHAKLSSKARRHAATQREPVELFEHGPSGSGLYTVRGSSGSVLPTPLPRTQLIPPEGNPTPTLPTLPQQEGPTILTGAPHPIPNLPHGTESFQDRASRCAFQKSLYNVPGTLSNQYMGSCLQ